MKCADCGFAIDPKYLGPHALAKGSSVRDPGEAVCQGCTASRVILVRQLSKIPNTIDQIRALRVPRVRSVA